MQNLRSIAAVDAACFSSSFCRPLYDSYCFAGFPDTILNAFGGENPRALPADVLPVASATKVIFVLVDAFGWRSLLRYTELLRYPSLLRLSEDAVVSKLTSQFPSTTAAHVTTMATGLPPARSGIYEWNMYLPEAGRIIVPLLFSLPRDDQRDTLLAQGIDPCHLLPHRSNLYHRLRDHGVESTVIQPSSYMESAYNRVLLEGVPFLGYSSYSGGLAALRERVLSDGSPHYYYYYFPDFDSAAHHHGIESPHADEQALTFFLALENELIEPLRRRRPGVLLLVTADHGQVEIDPTTTVYLDQLIPEIEQHISVSPSGHKLVPAGSSRDFFLHIEHDALSAVHDQLQSALQGVAEVFTTESMIQAGLFGSSPMAEHFLARVGNLAVLPYTGRSVYWAGHDGRFKERFYGHHGGLTRAEMEIPLLAAYY